MASTIPNLNSLRSGRRGPRLRGRRGAHGITDGEDGASAESAEAARDRVVQQTDFDASSSRMSAVALGYLDDAFAKAFFPPTQEISKRYPLINRGTYVRTRAIDRLVDRFLESAPHQKKQIVSLGAGSDTRFFRSCAGKHHVVYHELDFETNVNTKRTAIRASPDLLRMTAPPDNAAALYHLNAIDLRDLTKKSPPIIPGFDPDLPTLLLSECCLCYLPPDMASSVLQYFTMNATSSLAIILYEPIRPFDAFGRTMVSNLATRGIHLQTLKRFHSLEAQRQRLRLAGFTDGQGARDVYQIWRSDDWTAAEERQRIDRLEWLDEVEEWQLLASHYCVTWAWRGPEFGTAWEAVRGDRTSDEASDSEIM